MSAVFRTVRNDFDRLYRRHVASVYRYAYAVVGNHADAEDVTQQTFLNAYRAISEGTKPRKAENWLLTIAHNEVRKHFRRAQAKPVEVELDEEVADHAAERSEPSLTDVVRALQHLPPLQRSALVMREFEGRSYKEIAQILDVTQSALETMVFRARRALAEQLEGVLTCDEAERAVSQRLDGRLPRKDARRLKAHLHECPLCVRYADVQKRQRSLLRGFSIMPIPASLFLFRGEHAAAGLGTSAAVAGGSSTLAGGGLAGLATGFAAKAAAVTATVGVAGGVGYTAAKRPDAVRNPAPRVVGAATSAQHRQGHAIGNGAVSARGIDRPSRAHPALQADERKAHPRSAPPGKTKARGVARKAPAVARVHGTVPPGAIVRQTTPAALKPKPPRAPKAKKQPPAGRMTGHLKPARSNSAKPARAAGKPPVDPPAHPQPPHAGGRGSKN